MATRDKNCTLYVGGLDDQVTQQVLHAAFIPFGEITQIEIPPDPASTAPHRGFGFIEFEHPEDAKAAQDNMHLSELFGKTIKVNLARPLKGAGPGGRGPERAIWADEEWIKKHTLGEEASSTAADPEQGSDPRPEPSTA